jgi:hypothetical protein
VTVRACSKHWEEKKCIQGFGGKARKKRDHWKDFDIGGRIRNGKIDLRRNRIEWYGLDSSGLR